MNIDPESWGSISRKLSEASNQTEYPDTAQATLSEIARQMLLVGSGYRPFQGIDIRKIIDDAKVPTNKPKLPPKPKRISPVLLQCCLLISTS